MCQSLQRDVRTDCCPRSCRASATAPRAPTHRWTRNASVASCSASRADDCQRKVCCRPSSSSYEYIMAISRTSREKGSLRRSSSARDQRGRGLIGRTRGLLILADLLERDGARAVAMRLADFDGVVRLARLGLRGGHDGNRIARWRDRQRGAGAEASDARRDLPETDLRGPLAPLGRTTGEEDWLWRCGMMCARSSSR